MSLADTARTLADLLEQAPATVARQPTVLVQPEGWDHDVEIHLNSDTATPVADVAAWAALLDEVPPVVGKPYGTAITNGHYEAVGTFRYDLRVQVWVPAREVTAGPVPNDTDPESETP